ILDHKRLAEPLRQPLSNHPGGNVGWAAGGKPDNKAYRLRWISLPSCETRNCRQCDSSGCQMEKLSSMGKFHSEPPSHHSITSSPRASSDGGTVRPSACAVIKLTTSSNFVGCSTGISPGFVPRRILST